MRDESWIENDLPYRAYAGSDWGRHERICVMTADVPVKILSSAFRTLPKILTTIPVHSAVEIYICIQCIRFECRLGYRLFWLIFSVVVLSITTKSYGRVVLEFDAMTFLWIVILVYSYSSFMIIILYHDVGPVSPWILKSSITRLKTSQWFGG
jgi:hypothetical protein